MPHEWGSPERIEAGKRFNERWTAAAVLKNSSRVAAPSSNPRDIATIKFAFGGAPHGQAGSYSRASNPRELWPILSPEGDGA